MNCHPCGCRPLRFDHWLVCQHQVEVEIWPPNAEVYFADERFCDAANTQVRFDATVYNAPDAAVWWQVLALDGSPGQGKIDQTGLYTAPDRNGLASGLTEIITATANADPLRRAYAQVTLIGRGPEPPPRPVILLSPKRVYLYYQRGANNGFIDASNKHQVFRALVANAAPSLSWTINGPGTLSPAGADLCNYDTPDMGGDGVAVRVTATLQSDHSVTDEAEIMLVNYQWAGVGP